MRDFLFAIDNGHGFNTQGKCSPDGKFKEWEFNRDIASAVVDALSLRGVRAELLVPESHDVSLKERAHRVNNLCKKHGTENVILISVHVNAASNGKWSNARGWSCFTSKGKTLSDTVASIFYEAAEETMPSKTFRKEYSDGDPDWEENFYVLYHTLCAAILVENFFMDNKEDLAFLTSEEGRQAIIDSLVSGAIKCCETL